MMILRKFFLFVFFLPLISFSQKTYVPDNNFEQALINLGYDNVLDDSVFTASIDTIIALSIFNQNISSLIGIEDFASLSILRCSGNKLTILDLRKFILLFWQFGIYFSFYLYWR